jgi:hypothetical protein
MGGQHTDIDTDRVDDTSPPADDGGPPFADDVSDEDEAFLAHVERVMASDSTRTRAAVAANRTIDVPARTASIPTPSLDNECTETGVRQRLTCDRCGWTVECFGADADRFTRAGCLLCGGAVSARLADVEEPAPTAESWNKRRVPRKAPRGATRVEVRRLIPSTSPDVALALADVCADGVGVWLRCSVRPGELVDVSLARAGGGPAVRRQAEVRWCAPGGDWTYRAGLRLRQPLTAGDLMDLTV